jgi:hypothetical protein
MDRPKIIGVAEDADLESSRSQLVFSREMDDQTILWAYAAMGERETPPPSVTDAICGAVAQRLLDLNYQGGANIVMPVAGLLSRNIRGDGHLDTGEIDDGTLVSLRRQLLSANRPGELMTSGVALGDRATHFAAGLGSRHIHNVMHRGSAERYMKAAALSGYQSALDAAGRTRSSTSSRVKATVPTLLAQYEDVVHIIRSLFEKPDKKLDGLLLH